MSNVRWVQLAGVFVAGQGLVRIVNITVGLLLVHVLPIDQFGLYTVASALLALTTMGANPGVSQAVITQGAGHSDDRKLLGGLVNAALRHCLWFYVAILPVLLAISLVMLIPYDWSLLGKITVVVLVAIVGWVRISIMIATAILNVRHDSGGLFRIGLSEGLTRLALIPLCFVWPYVTLALLINLAGVGLAKWISLRRIAPIVDRKSPPPTAQTRAIREFVLPLVPTVIYAALQGQIAVLTIGLFGDAAAIAEVGAVTRLNQIIVLGMMLNPFLVQPILARQIDRARFINQVSFIIAGLVIIASAVMASAFVVPNWWLFILGDSYANLEREVPIALATGMLTLVGGTLYTVAISRNRTVGQHWSIAPSIIGQATFAALHGVTSAYDALVLSLIPALAYAIVQAVLVIQGIRNWRSGMQAFTK